MNEIQDTQTIASLDAEQFGNVALGLAHYAGAILTRNAAGVVTMTCEDRELVLIDAPTTTVEFLFTFAGQHTN